MAQNLNHKTVLSRDTWDEIYDAVDLARDALGEGPQDVDYNFLINNVMHLRVALTAAHRAMEKAQ